MVVSPTQQKRTGLQIEADVAEYVQVVGMCHSIQYDNSCNHRVKQ